MQNFVNSFNCIWIFYKKKMFIFISKFYSIWDANINLNRYMKRICFKLIKNRELMFNNI